MKSIAVAVALLACTGAVLKAQDYATFLGGYSPGYGTEHAFAVAIDSAGHAIIGGGTASVPFPATRRYGTNDGGGFLIKLSTDGSRALYSAYFEGIEIVSVRASDSVVYALGHTGGAQAAITLGQYAGGYSDAVVLKLDAQGELLWARYLGGNDLELPRAMTLDSAGNVWAVGITTSTNFPATAQALQKNSSGGFDGFLAKIDPAGTLVFASYLGGAGDEFLHSVAVHSTGRILLGGVTSSSSLAGFNPTALHGPLGGTDAFAASLRPDGAGLDWLSLIGGSGRDAALAVLDHHADSLAILGSTTSDNFPVTPGVLQTNLAGNSDLWLARLSSADGAALLGATYLGSIESEDVGDPFWAAFTLDGEPQERHLFPENVGFAVGPGGNLLVAARNNSPVFPAWGSRPVSFGGNREGFFARVTPNFASLLDLKFLGGATDDEARALAIDSAGSAYIAGTIYSPSVPPFFPATPGALQTNFAGGAMDGFLVRIPATPAPAVEDSFATPRPLFGARAGAVSSIDSATRETGEPAHSPGIQKTLWFAWQAPGSGRLVASTAGSSFPAGVAVYSGASLASLSLLGIDRQSSELLDHSRIVVPVAAGAECRIAILGQAEDMGLARLSLAFSEPSNDDFAAAIQLDGLPANAAATNVNATAEPAEGAHHESIPSRSLWWKWTAPDNRSVAVSTFGSDFDTVVAVYSGDSLNALERIASNDDANGAVTSEAVFLPQSGRTYRIAVDGQRDQAGAIRLRIVPNDPPANDDFSARAPLAGSAQSIAASNLRATLELGEPGLQFTNILGEVDPYFSRATVWWSWQSPKTGRLRIDTIGSDFDTRLGLYRGESLASLVRVAASDDIDRTREQRASRLELDVMEGARFEIQVDGSIGSPAGVIRLNLRLSFPPRILPQTLLRTGGAIQFQAEGASGEAYRVETSSDLRTWSPAGDFVPEANGAWPFTVTASHPRQLFIRLASRP